MRDAKKEEGEQNFFLARLDPRRRYHGTEL